MKRSTALISGLTFGICLAVTFRFFDNNIAPLFFNARLERIHENDLPKAIIENHGIYFRMKADDFFLPLPAGARAYSPHKNRWF